MVKKSYSINFEYDYDFILIGICSPLKDYHMCYKINKELGTSLSRSAIDISMDFFEGIEKGQFSLYEYWDKQYENQWYLLSNKCQLICDERLQNEGTIFDGIIQNEEKTKYLVPENSIVDFYLQVHGILSENSKLKIIKKIRKLNRVVSAYEICINNIASKDNLIIK
ncbi:MAG: hypothetical protein CM15mP23_05090 [Cryomorphaceae bacterium]|nr:MAG: hypothetical protein CM15mP23_05090 [Cryomorphaceae bacterium]|tara:strand:- start:850 stop:1350 length:501 start_codon:yes stop_codon:yes gene_type:complete